MKKRAKPKPLIMMSYRADPAVWTAIKNECTRRRISVQQYFNEAATGYLQISKTIKAQK